MPQNAVQQKIMENQTEKFKPGSLLAYPQWEDVDISRLWRVVGNGLAQSPLFNIGEAEGFLGYPTSQPSDGTA